MGDVISCVIPVHNEENFIVDVITSMPDFVSHIVVVNDDSTDNTREQVKNTHDPRIILIDHKTNLGVGAAVATGYKKAIELGADIVVKVDGDGQMDLAQMQRLISPIQNGVADYTKGVRFRDKEVVQKMPVSRLIGNVGLSFLTKVASGYWHVFDPTNGYTAICQAALKRLKIDNLNKGYLYETDILIHLYGIDAVVVDVEIQAKYGDEISGLSLFKSLFAFPLFLIRAFIKRIFWRYFVFDFSAFSVFFLSGIALFGFGFVFGIYNWVGNYLDGVSTPTGTIMLAAVPLLLGFQLLLQAVVLDINNVPKDPIQSKPQA